MVRIELYKYDGVRMMCERSATIAMTNALALLKKLSTGTSTLLKYATILLLYPAILKKKNYSFSELVRFLESVSKSDYSECLRKLINI